MVATASEKPKLVLCFTTHCKIVSVSRSRFIDDSLYQKLLTLVQVCWRYLKISQVFLRRCVGYVADYHRSYLEF